jgi:chromosome segregation ATPase
MKLHIRIPVIIIAFAIALSPLFVLQVNAQEATLSDDQLAAIRSNCSSTTNTLNQLHSNDALLRVNQGQLYESILTKLIQPFDERVSHTSFSTSDLKSIETNYGQALNSFRTDYQTYEQQLSSALNVNCSKQPQQFYGSIDQARTDRNIVHADIVQLNADATDYQAALKAFEQNYDPTAASTGDTN